MAIDRKFVVTGLTEYDVQGDRMLVWAADIGDEYHTLHDLYRHRMALTIALFHAWHAAGVADISVMKAKLHADGTMFEGGYFIVMAVTPEGQISYHYKLEHWDAFRIPEVSRTPPWDGHGSADVLQRLAKVQPWL